MKIAGVLVSALLSAVFCFFNPAYMSVDISGFTLINFLSLIACLILFVSRREKIKKIKLSKTESFFSLLLGLCLTISFGLVHGDEFKVFYASLKIVIFTCAQWAFCSFFSVYLFKYIFCICNEFLCKENSYVDTKNNGFIGCIIKKIEDNKFRFYFFVLVSAWLIPFIINFPGLIMFDTKFQFCMYNHIPNKYTFASVLIDESQYITQHHSVPHTLLVGFILNLGKSVFNSYDAGIFIYCVIQYLFIAAVVSYMIKCIKQYLGIKFTLITLIFFALHPFFPISAILVTKDIYFCGFFVLYILNYYKLVRNPEIIRKKKFFVTFIMLSLSLVLLRNNALYTLIVISCGMFIFIKNRKTVALYIGIILAFNIVYTNAILPAFNISKGSVREMLSIPLQQTARYITKHSDEVTFEEHTNISGILQLRGIINRYNPELSDPVKDGFRPSATGEDLKAYFKTWGKMFLKHPLTYTEALVMQNYGYYCPGVKESVTYDCINDYYARCAMKTSAGADIEVYEPNEIKTAYYYFQNYMYMAPFINLVMDSGAYIWLWIIIMFVIVRKIKDKKYLMYYLPYFAYLLFVMAGPVNGTIYSRYIMPFIYTLPMMFLPLFEYRKNKKAVAK